MITPELVVEWLSGTRSMVIHRRFGYFLKLSPGAWLFIGALVIFLSYHPSEQKDSVKRLEVVIGGFGSSALLAICVFVRGSEEGRVIAQMAALSFSSCEGPL